MSLDLFFPILYFFLEMAVGVTEVLANATVVIKRQCISISNQYLYTFNLQCYMSIISQWIWRENLYGLCSGQFIQSFIYLLKVFFSFIFLFKFSAEFLTYDSWFFIYRNSNGRLSSMGSHSRTWLKWLSSSSSSNGNISHLLAYFLDGLLLILMFPFIVS